MTYVFGTVVFRDLWDDVLFYDVGACPNHVMSACYDDVLYVIHVLYYFIINIIFVYGVNFGAF